MQHKDTKVQAILYGPEGCNLMCWPAFWTCRYRAISATKYIVFKACHIHCCISKTGCMTIRNLLCAYMTKTTNSFYHTEQV